MAAVVSPTDVVTRLPKPPDTIPTGIEPSRQESSHPRRLAAALGALGIVLVACIAILALIDDAGFSTRPRASQPVAGLTIFAVFFVGALAVERLLEPFAGILLPKADKKAEVKEKEDTAAQLVGAASTTGADQADATNALQVAAKAKAELADLDWMRTVIYWALASGIGMYVSAAMKIYILRTVGIGDATRWQEVLATGLIIGGGTKPLHDLTKLITAQKESAQAAK